MGPRYVFLFKQIAPDGLEWYVCVDTKNKNRLVAFTLTTYLDLQEKGKVDR